MPSASSTVADDATGLSRQSDSGEAGNYTVTLLPPGTYRVTVLRDGFRPITRSGIELQVNQVARLDFAREVGNTSERVDVVAMCRCSRRRRTFGNVSRTLPDARGPSLTSIDLSLVRDIKILERFSLQVRADAFNLFNTPHFAMPVTNMANLSFGQITATNISGLPRVIQFALKLNF